MSCVAHGVPGEARPRQYLPRTDREREKTESSLSGGEADIESVTHAAR